MDKLKIRIAVLGLALPLALGGCRSAPEARVPVRAPVAASLVAAHDESAGSGRNDGALGTTRAAPIRRNDGMAVVVRDRQQIINGTTYTDYDAITRSRDRFAR